MSASERLKALERQMPWHGSPDPGDFGGHPYSANERSLGYGTPDDPRFRWNPEFRALGRSLPELIAVVKKLEWCADAFDYISGRDVAGWDAHVPTEVVAIGARDQAHLALEALDVKLANE